jgi:hypothetical protein
VAAVIPTTTKADAVAIVAANAKKAMVAAANAPKETVAAVAAAVPMATVAVALLPKRKKTNDFLLETYKLKRILLCFFPVFLFTVNTMLPIAV